VLDYNLVLKHNELYSVGNITTDGSGERAVGLYVRDTRHLSHFATFLNGLEPSTLSIHQHSATTATVTGANPMLPLGDEGGVLPHQILVRQEVELGDCLWVRFELHNYTRRSIPLTLGLEFSADFRDLFDIRGFARGQRGDLLQPRIDHREIRLGYAGLDEALVETTIRFDRDPESVLLTEEPNHRTGLVPLLPGEDDVVWEGHAEMPVVRAAFPLVLDAGASWHLAVEIEPRPATADKRAGAILPVRSGWSQSPVTSDNPFFDQIMARTVSDFEELQTQFADGSLPAAGIPWFVAPFGRDSLIAGLQTLHLAPERAIGTLRVLAALQGTKVDPVREEQPGKILHEMRYGEMARLKEVPHTPYFGSIDATPLWIWLFAETVQWTGDPELFEELLPTARRALDWIERFGDLDSDGFVEYRSQKRGAGGIANQVWKDSFDSLNHADGTKVDGPIAAVEVQGYVYAAYVELAETARAFGKSELARELERKAETLRARVEKAFWLEPEGFYAQALDGHKNPVRALSSNPGHLLMARLPAPDRAARVIARFRQDDFATGWGIRTLSARALTYNPMSYHNGSVWPHDNSLIGAGFYRYGDREAGEALTTALFDAAAIAPLRRLPELYCGFARTMEDHIDCPVAYPVSCTPQAWAAGAMPLLLREMLGLEVDLSNRTLVVNPTLPLWLNTVTIHDLRVLGHRGSITFRREQDRVVWESTSLPFSSMNGPRP
jgi:glycogen debranching enzyme